MKVKIGPYPSRLNTTIYADYMTKKYGYSHWPSESKQTKFERLLDKFDDIIQSCYRPINYFLDKREQKVNVKIDRWDTWSMDATLAHIIVPMLRQLKDTKQGAPHVDKEDVPEALWPNEAEEALYAKNGQIDIHFFARWDYVMDEMIFAFESKLNGDWEDQFYSGNHDRITVPVDKDGNEVAKEDAEYYEWRKGPNHTFEIDMEGRKSYQERISNGFRLFGKYYESLWD
jgi:hypothetical protein